jgi:NAD-dependent deacetylase
VIDIHGDVHDILCPRCSHPLRPDVVLFGELLPSAKVSTMERELERGFDMVFTIGTTSLFPYIARPVLEAARQADVRDQPRRDLRLACRLDQARAQCR